MFLLHMLFAKCTFSDEVTNTTYTLVDSSLQGSTNAELWDFRKFRLMISYTDLDINIESKRKENIES